jgi:hypothetical protein
MPSSWGIVAAASAPSSACTVISFMSRTARPKPSKKISLSNVNREFNNSVQDDNFHLDGVYRRPILHAVDTHISFSVIRLCETGTFSRWQVLLSVNGYMFTDPQLRCRATRRLRKVTSRTCCVAKMSLSRNRVHADITKL